LRVQLGLAIAVVSFCGLMIRRLRHL